MEIRKRQASLAPLMSASLHDDEIHVWIFERERYDALAKVFQDWLSPIEMERARKYHGDELQKRFIANRAFLRDVLARYSRITASQVAFDYGSHGKPLAIPLSPERLLHFNLTHSGSVSLCAVAINRAIGIDLEQIREIKDMEGIATRFFSPAEAQFLGCVPQSEQRATFFKVWTGKEAFIKGTGDGLFRSLDSFMISFGDNDTGNILERNDEGIMVPSKLWHLEYLDAPEGFVSALALQSSADVRLSMIEWNGALGLEPKSDRAKTICLRRKNENE